MAIPVFLTIALMPFTYSITNGIGAGVISYAAAAHRGGTAARRAPADVGDRRALRRLLRPAAAAAAVLSIRRDRELMLTIVGPGRERTTLDTAALAHDLRLAVMRLSRRLRNQRVDTSVTLTHLAALSTLKRHGPMSPGELAAHERVQPPSMTRVVVALEGMGLVTRTPHPTDGRQVIIGLSPAAGRPARRGGASAGGVAQRAAAGAARRAAGGAARGRGDPGQPRQ